ncbi:MAG TPA: hypothetical protein VMW62_09965 [Chloroflexota bacterium]|nr:hypothetical protein [Chloroflexota bacterium]
MRSDVLTAYPSAQLKVYVVWFSMLPGDSRQFLDTKLLSDPRVTNYWDQQKVIGTWYSQHVTHQRGTTWDAFFLYGPNAQWTDVPQPEVTDGGSVIGAHDDLLRGLTQLGIAQPNTAKAA